jgi:hypothetical protein
MPTHFFFFKTTITTVRSAVTLIVLSQVVLFPGHRSGGVFKFTPETHCLTEGVFFTAVDFFFDQRLFKMPKAARLPPLVA